MCIQPPKNFDDFKRIAEIYNAAIRPFADIYSEEEMAAYGELLHQSPEDFFEAQNRRTYSCVALEDKICGFMAFHKKRHNIIWMNSLYIDPAYQKHGLGSFLLNSLPKLVSPDTILIALETHPKAKWAIQFYRKNGYQIVNDLMHTEPYNEILDKEPVEGRPILAKLISQ